MEHQAAYEQWEMQHQEVQYLAVQLLQEDLPHLNTDLSMAFLELLNGQTDITQRYLGLKAAEFRRVWVLRMFQKEHLQS